MMALGLQTATSRFDVWHSMEDLINRTASLSTPVPARSTHLVRPRDHSRHTPQMHLRNTVAEMSDISQSTASQVLTSKEFLKRVSKNFAYLHREEANQRRWSTRREAKRLAGKGEGTEDGNVMVFLELYLIC